MQIDKYIELLGDYCDRGMVTLGPDFRDAVSAGKRALTLVKYMNTGQDGAGSTDILEEIRKLQDGDTPAKAITWTERLEILIGITRTVSAQAEILISILEGKRK